MRLATCRPGGAGEGWLRGATVAQLAAVPLERAAAAALSVSDHNIHGEKSAVQS